MTTITSINEAREAGTKMLASSEWMTAVYYALPFGEVAVTRDGNVYLAAEYNAGMVGR